MKFGQLTLDPLAYGSQGSAVLGIRDSGKTYTATLLAERLFDAGIPFIAFDPVGVWRFLRVPGKGRGYPVVVAGGQEGDLPLSPATAPAIVEAAMQQGISLVIDLFSIDLSKSDWRKIVRDCVLLLLHKNKPHGMRHVFIEEAAEFCPQKVWDGEVYAAVEKLARMGGNSRLGYTLINQRAEEVNKAVLELCDNLFLHRQKGKNSLTSLQKWLDVGAAKGGKAIIDTLSTLPSGECWAWMAGTETPVHVKVPAKNSLHPDRRVMRDTESKPAAAVDVGKFVASLQAALPKVEADAKANDPKALRAEIADLKRQMVAAVSAHLNPADPAALERARQEGADAEREAAAVYVNRLREDMAVILDSLHGRVEAVHGLAAALMATWPSPPTIPSLPAPRAPVAPKAIARIAPPVGVAPAKPTGPAPDRIRRAVAWWHAQGHDAPTRVQVAFLARYSPRSSGYEKQLSNLSSAGDITFPAPGCVALANRRSVKAADFGTPLEAVRAVLDPRMWRVLEPLLNGKTMTRADLAAASSYSDRSSGYEKTLSQMRGLSVIDFPSPGSVKAADWLFV